MCMYNYFNSKATIVCALFMARACTIAACLCYFMCLCPTCLTWTIDNEQQQSLVVVKTIDNEQQQSAVAVKTIEVSLWKEEKT